MPRRSRSAFICLAGMSLIVGSGAQAIGSPDATPSKRNDVTNEQLPINQRFRDLDHYLKYLQIESHNDGKWYKQIRPGVYEVQTGNLHIINDKQQRIFTREELSKKFGFED